MMHMRSWELHLWINWNILLFSLICFLPFLFWWVLYKPLSQLLAGLTLRLNECVPYLVPLSSLMLDQDEKLWIWLFGADLLNIEFQDGTIILSSPSSWQRVCLLVVNSIFFTKFAWLNMFTLIGFWFVWIDCCFP